MHFSYMHRIEPSLGKVESLAAHSCKEIREVLSTDCSNIPNSGIYWVWKDNPMQVNYAHTFLWGYYR